jgi:hypothetical protein
MCVLICANPKVREWLDVPLAVAHRQSLQVAAVCHAGTHGVLHDNASDEQPKELDEADERRVMKRSAWLQAYCSHQAYMARCRASSPEWHKALDAIANAWGRLLSLVGLRW